MRRSTKSKKNKLNHSLRIAKRLYYEKKRENAKSHMKSTWRVLNEIMNRKTQKNRLPSTFKIDNREISNPKEIANRFCEYFTNIGFNLAILFKNQYGFRKGRSISFPLLHLFEKISSAIDRREYTVGIFLDLSKAFDTVNFNILFDK